MDAIRDRLGRVLEGIIPDFEIDLHAPIVRKIEELKVEKSAIVLAHNYQVPEIFHGIADFTGDSLALARKAAGTRARIIVFCGVHFMAETAKILNPGRKVLLPDLEAGCSLAESISAQDVRDLRASHPGVPAVCYINTTAAVKAECDACCTSGNALAVVEAMPGDELIFIPDEYLTANVQRQTKKRLIPWPGRCMVHETFEVEMLRAYRLQFEGLEILAHPECSPEVVAEADFCGSTSAMLERVARTPAKRVLLVTECGMADNIRNRHPDKEFVSSCTICPHMKKIQLDKVLASLESESPEILVDEEVARRAKLAVERMLAIG
ncbi:MAG: quinolinate synthase NadA [Planctomycetes bacterium]|nr:quinolinate synthase NadA [Planctomycetota bacterium]